MSIHDFVIFLVCALSVLGFVVGIPWLRDCWAYRPKAQRMARYASRTERIVAQYEDERDDERDEDDENDARTIPDDQNASAPHQHAEQDAQHGACAGASTIETGDSLTLNAAEIAAVRGMILHKATAAAPTKTTMIHAGFGIRSRGSGPKYQRASRIYESFFGDVQPVEKFRKLDEDRKPLIPAEA